jgi:AcrR family transcriptional regulator
MAAVSRSEQIRAVALEALYDRGYHAMSLRDIARDVGIQAPSLYNYFPSKQGLLFELFKGVMEDLTEQAEAAVAACEDRSAQGRLREAVRAFVLFNIRHPHEAAVSDAGFNALTLENRERIVGLRDRFEHLFTGLLEEGRDGGEFVVDDVSVIRNTLLSSCARIYFWYRPEGTRVPEDVAELISNYLIAGLLPRPEEEQ